ncbi:glycosyltransferase family 9 protein [Tistrella sp. BH-R2-4]|uniref:Glycosyltransferase family 9 protein n=1 Tax=Tistrella arctica TaxID=3133430 RepID=A0ABU9YMH6_9PROT
MAQLFIGPTRLGDAILVSGVLAWMRDDAPDSPITIACGPQAALAFSGWQGVEAMHVVHKRPHHRHWLDLWQKTRNRRWRRIVDLRRSALPWLLRADARYRIPPGLPGEHRVIQAARTLGLPPQMPRIDLSAAQRAHARRDLPDGAPALAIGPGASQIFKTWPVERFAAVADRLLSTGGPLAGGRLVLLGSDAERRDAAALLNLVPADRLVDGFGLDIPASAALLERSALFIGNDSAMMHLAVAAGARTVGLFGPTRDDHYGPWGPQGLVVRTPESVDALQARLAAVGGGGSLMASLTVDAVSDAVLRRWPDLSAGAHPA